MWARTALSPPAVRTMGAFSTLGLVVSVSQLMGGCSDWLCLSVSSWVVARAGRVSQSAHGWFGTDAISEFPRLQAFSWYRRGSEPDEHGTCDAASMGNYAHMLNNGDGCQQDQGLAYAVGNMLIDKETPCLPDFTNAASDRFKQVMSMWLLKGNVCGTVGGAKFNSDEARACYVEAIRIADAVLAVAPNRKNLNQKGGGKPQHNTTLKF